MFKIEAAARLLATSGWKVMLSYKSKGAKNSVTYEFKPSHTIRTEDDARKAAVRKLKTGKPTGLEYKVVRVSAL